jgi:hypothetical protein
MDERSKGAMEKYIVYVIKLSSFSKAHKKTPGIISPEFFLNHVAD